MSNPSHKYPKYPRVHIYINGSACGYHLHILTRPSKPITTTNACGSQIWTMSTQTNPIPSIWMALYAIMQTITVRDHRRKLVAITITITKCISACTSSMRKSSHCTFPKTYTKSQVPKILAPPINSNAGTKSAYRSICAAMAATTATIKVTRIIAIAINVPQPPGDPWRPHRRPITGQRYRRLHWSARQQRRHSRHTQ